MLLVLVILAAQPAEDVRSDSPCSGYNLVGSTCNALGAEGEVGEPLVAPEAGERGVVRHAAVQRELGRGRGGGLRGGRGAGAGGGGAGALRRHRVKDARSEGDNEGTTPNSQIKYF